MSVSQGLDTSARPLPRGFASASASSASASAPANCIHGSCTRRIALFYRRDQGYRYNELVFHFRRFTAHLPASVEAMFILPGSTPKDVALARKVRAAFREEFRLSEEVAPPLVMYDPSRSPQEPFTRVGVES